MTKRTHTEQCVKCGCDITFEDDDHTFEDCDPVCQDCELGITGEDDSTDDDQVEEADRLGPAESSVKHRCTKCQQTYMAPEWEEDALCRRCENTATCRKCGCEFTIDPDEQSSVHLFERICPDCIAACPDCRKAWDNDCEMCARCKKLVNNHPADPGPKN